ncbi:signal peptide peptidase SppA, 36K type [Staphylococcus sp. HGB0015]|uniref:Signal peptide peptidase SppA n=1 Tax=Staphylococcus schleiferi TaxID=1295 RepID=A0ABX0FXQ2_STASC|nr:MULTISPECIES: signal peptide peptidase SppA [Staphylococcus]QGS45648.1 signal peptide peptidase SppA [Mammaliicoccus fleurettii]EPD51608.1 signal peptide peptidase SppA, 36K type [Staphylococcus sp. HGB0015]NHA33833.1 signal peptide peptidase SppA [Staphylococcus schleiferi]NHA38288.1 signal peptide peptidase SppA [Staphylococcus schleiferi]NHA40618.1 signal peptide peptidase SppA [Staphylococcus schleiferi]
MSKRIIAIILASVIIIGGILTSALTSIVSSFFNGEVNINAEAPSTVVQEGDKSNQIAEITVNGAIQDTGAPSLFGGGGEYNHQVALNQLETIKNDDSIKGVLLNVNSPGGGTYESDEFYHKLKAVKDAGKKIYVQMETLAASGGYYISAPADKIYAGPQTLTGSIGVISESKDYSKLLDDLGIKTNTIKSGAHKDILSGSRKMTDEERQILQSINKDSFDQFVDVVKKARHMSEAKVRKLADGRIYSAQQAKANGLIDQIAYKDQTLKDLEKAIKADDPQIITFDQNSSDLTSFLGMKSFVNGLRSDVQNIKQILNNEAQTRPMYKYEG